MTRAEFESQCNDMLAKLVCPMHGISPDPARISHHWSRNVHGFMAKSPWCPGGSAGPCDKFLDIMNREVKALARRVGPIVDPN
jgi:hypothetical protein